MNGVFFFSAIKMMTMIGRREEHFSRITRQNKEKKTQETREDSLPLERRRSKDIFSLVVKVLTTWVASRLRFSGNRSLSISLSYSIVPFVLSSFQNLLSIVFPFYLRLADSSCWCCRDARDGEEKKRSLDILTRDIKHMTPEKVMPLLESDEE